MTDAVKLPISAPGADKVEAFLERIVKALDKLEKEAKPAGESLDNVAKPGTLERLRSAGESIQTTANNTLELAQKAGAAVQKLAELAAGTERTQEALNRLGPVARQVEEATAGMVSATEAYQLQQSLVRSGLRITGDQLVTLTRGARDHARAMGLETSEAIQQLTQSIRQNDAGGLRELGIVVRDGTSRARTLQNALGQLGREQRNTQPITRSLGEDTARFGRSMADVTGAVAALIAQGTGLQSFLSAAAAGFAELTKEILDYIDADARRPGQQADAERRNRSRESYAAAVRAFRQEARRTGANVPNLPGADQLSEAARDALTQRLNQLNQQTGAAANQRITVQTAGGGTRTDTVGNLGGQVFRADSAGFSRGLRLTTAQLEAAGLGGRSGLTGLTLAESQSDANRRAALEAIGRDIQREALGESDAETRRRADVARRNAAAARAGAGAVDTAGVGVAVTNQAALRAAQLELGLANQSLGLLGERFDRLGDVVSREEQLVRLREEAARTAAQDAESEDARVARVAAARNALLAALTEERDRRQQLRDLDAAQAATDASNLAGALGAARGGGRLTGSQSALVGRAGAVTGALGATVDSQRAQVAAFTQELARQNVPLTEQLRLRGLIAGLQSTIAQNETTLLQLSERDRENTRAALDTRQAEFDQWSALYQAARDARDQLQDNTASERDALAARAQALTSVTSLEQGYRQLLAQSSQELAAARTEEERNGALNRRLGILQRLTAAESARRNLEREDARNNFGAQAGQRLAASIGASATQAERFAGVAESAFGTFTDAFATSVLSVAKGELTIRDALFGILKAVLETIAKESVVQALKSAALGFGKLAAGNIPGATLDFTAAGIWGAVGVATGIAAAVVPTPGAAGAAAGGAGAGAASGASAARTNDRPAGAGDSGGGGLVLNIKVDGALLNAGVEEGVVRAIDRAGLRGYRPRELRRAAGG